MMSERQWWPVEWADEVMPPGRASPNDFIVPVDGRFFLGYPLDAMDATEAEKRIFNRELDAGEIVKFVCCDPLGEIEVAINPDGSYVAHGQVPERADHFWLAGDADTLASSLDEFVANLVQLLEEPTTETVSMAWWSEEQPHKLVIDYMRSDQGHASFVAVSAAEATQ